MFLLAQNNPACCSPLLSPHTRAALTTHVSPSHPSNISNLLSIMSLAHSFISSWTHGQSCPDEVDQKWKFAQSAALTNQTIENGATLAWS